MSEAGDLYVATWLMNLLFGLPGLGYPLAWVSAMAPTNRELRAAAERERLSEEANRAVVIMERQSRGALDIPL
jgi:hypothetical protein